MMKKVLIVTSSPKKNREDFFNYENLTNIQRNNDSFVELKFVTGNKQPLAKVYNRYLLNPQYRDYDIAFIHEDAVVDDFLFLEKLQHGLEEFDVVGVAGCIPPFDLQRSGGLCTWHNMCLPENRYGQINTYKPKPVGEKYTVNDEKYRTVFGPTPRRALLIDGVFIGVNVSKCWTLAQFDENCPADFHFYDLLFSLLANKRGLKVGVLGINLNHCSPGLTHPDAQFFEGNRYFGDILHGEGFLAEKMPDKPELGAAEVIETESGLILRRTSVPQPILPRLPSPYYFIPEGGSHVVVGRRVKRPGKLTEETKNVKDFVHVNNDKSGCSWWRMCLIDQYGNYSRRANICTITTTIDSTSFWDRNFDALRIQREYSDRSVAYYRMLNRMFKDRGYKTKIIWEVDDVVIGGKLPKFNMAKNFFNQPHIQDNMKRIVELCDHVTVVSEYMRDLYEPFFMGKECRVLENYSHKGWFDGLYDYDRRMRLYEENKKQPRIILAGGGTHFLVGSTNPADLGDYGAMLKTIIATRKDFKWVFMGHIPASLEPFVQNGDMESIPWANLVEYPVKLEQTNAQVLLAPLAPNDFNRAKSNIKERESYYLGRPCVVQDLEPYKTALHKFKTPDEAIDQIKSILKDEQTYGDWCKKYRSLADGCWMEDVWDTKIVPAYS